MSRAKELPRQDAVETAADAVLEVAEDVAAFVRAASFATAGDIVLMQRAFARIARDASQAVCSLNQAFQLAVSREEIARMEKKS